MTELKNAWWRMMVKKCGSEEAVREFMRSNQKKAMAVPNRRKGGFAALPTEKVKEISQQALNKRYNKEDFYEKTKAKKVTKGKS